MLLLTHTRQCGTGHGGESEEVDLEHATDLGVLALLDGGEVTDAGIVHQHIDAAEPGLRRVHRRRDLRRVGHIQLQHQRIFHGGELAERVGVARRHDNVAAGGQELLGKLPSEAGRAAGDEPDRLAVDGVGDVVGHECRSAW